MRRYLLIIGLIIGLGFSAAVFGEAEADFKDKADTERRAVIVVLDRLLLGDLQAPAFERLLANSAVGLMNTNTGGIRNVENTHVSIGSGSRAVGTGAAFSAYDARETVHRVEAGEEFFRRTGVRPDENAVVHLGIARVRQLTDDVPSSAEVGVIGRTLRETGMTTAVIGNADWDGESRRHAATIAMDQNGLVDMGHVGRDLLIRDPDFPGEYRTDYDQLLERFRACAEADLIVIETGDLARLDEARNEVLPAMMAEHRKTAINRSAVFINRLLDELDLTRDLLLVVVPTPKASAISAGNLLTPLVAAGPGIEPGLLTAPSTRREGIILNIDVAPTVIQHLGLEIPKSVTGRAMYSLAGAGDLADLDALNQRLVMTHNSRVPIIKTYMSVIIGTVIVVLYMILVPRSRLIDRRYLHYLILLVMSFPLAALLIVPFQPRSPAEMVGLLLIIMLFVGGIAALLSRKSRNLGFGFLALATAGTIVVDLLLGSPLQKQSLLSYDPLGGARFYGLGNEYMGVLIGSIILGAASVLTQWPRRRMLIILLTVLAFGITLFAVANPKLGANMGGSITASVAFVITVLLFLGVRFTRRVILLAGGGVLAFLAGLTMIDFLRGVEQQSHIGRAARLVVGGGPVQGLQEAFNIIERKVSMNWKLLKYTIWSRVFLAMLGGFVLLFYLPVGRMQVFKDRCPDLYRGFVGIIIGAVVALAVNDSGVVAAATTMIFAGLPLMNIYLQDF